MLQPNNKNQTQKPAKKNNILIIVISVIFGIVLIAGIGSSISQGKKNKQEATDSQTDEPIATQEQVATEPDIQYEDVDAIDTLEIISDEIFSREESKYVFNMDLSFPDAFTIADGVNVDIGTSISFTPLKSCLYKYDTNRTFITHTSGTVMGITRQGYDERPDIDKMDAVLKENFKSSGTSSVSIKSIFINEKCSGRQAIGKVTVDGIDYSMQMSYIVYDSQMFTIVGLAPEGSEDFFNLILGSIRFGGKSLNI